MIGSNRHARRPAQVFLFAGAGEAGTGIAQLIADQIAHETGAPVAECRRKIWLTDTECAHGDMHSRMRSDACLEYARARVSMSVLACVPVRFMT